MEHTSYWKWARTKLIQDVTTTPPLFNRSSYNEYSWEEQAFAEDSNGLLGGCAWPPRSYTCSFCRRVLRSAQALGGHMNVHRRDRARLKQSSNPVDEDFTPNPNPGALELKLELGNCKKRNCEDDDEEEDEVVCSNNKRRRISEVFKVSPRLVEELDLELRLGEPPKLKLLSSSSSSLKPNPRPKPEPMDADRSSSKETAEASNQENQSTSPLKATVTKSYDCIFCKRGFSNAQALGGHMNIHRKDRARPNKPINMAPLPFMGYVPMYIMAQELALFVERPSQRDDRASSNLAPVVEELDLELRLGPERPNHDSMRLREFL